MISDKKYFVALKVTAPPGRLGTGVVSVLATSANAAISFGRFVNR